MDVNSASIGSRFDERAAEWDANPARVALARAVVEAVRAAVALRPDMRVLDFGAGTGLVSLGLLPFVAEVTASDASPGMLARLEEKGKALGATNLHVLPGDVAQAELPPGHFDLIVSSMTLHHLPDVPLVLRRLRPALRDGGWIALADLCAEDGSFHEDKTGVFHFGFACETVCRWLAEAGFAQASCHEVYAFNKPRADGMTRTFPVFLATCRAGG